MVVGAGGLVVAKTVPTSWDTVGAEVPERVAVIQPVATALWGDTLSQAWAAGFHHERVWPGARPQTLIVAALKEPPGAVWTSK